MLSLYVHKSNVKINITKFPAGETHLSIEDNQIIPSGFIHGMITMNFRGNEDLINLLLLVDAAKRFYPKPLFLSLTMNYVPYARQDRVCNKGESLSIAVVAALINSQKFLYVYTTDNHSEVSTSLIDNCINISVDVATKALVTKLPKGLNTILVAPDAGSNKKVYGFAKYHGFTNVIRADKTRDVATGKITGTKVYFELAENSGLMNKPAKTNRDFCIIDDICDGGYTFVQLAKELKKYTTGKIYLYVSHGIFSKKLDPFNGLIDTVFTSNSWYNKEYLERMDSLGPGVKLEII